LAACPEAFALVTMTQEHPQDQWGGRAFAPDSCGGFSSLSPGERARVRALCHSADIMRAFAPGGALFEVVKLGAEVPWVVMDTNEPLAASLAAEVGIPHIMARLLVNRGVAGASEARAFLEPDLSQLHDPALLPDLEAGAERLARAVERGERICVHGDYDVDGVTSTALLVRTLRALKADVCHRLPHRRLEGYGIKPAAVEEAAGQGVSLIVTCDCGITAFEAIDLASERGIDVIVTDHHEPGSELPRAVAVIDPKRSDAEYPFTELAGVGVALKLAQALVRRLGHSEESFLSRFVDLAALGTVGDVVPLLGENRIIVKHGLEAIPVSKKIGLRTMLRSAGIDGKPVTAYSLGFVLGPRINAVGRMDDANGALRLLLTTDEDEARNLAREMERFNTERRAEQERILSQALEQVAAKDLDSTRVLVLSADGWNSGVIGVVAGKLCESFGRPTIVISRDEESGIGGGSARSTPPFVMIDGLRECSDLLEGFGGHAQAAGLAVRLDKLGAFEERINALAAELIPKEELVPRIEVEAELEPADISDALAEAISAMEPFGEGNPEPLFMTRGLSVLEKRRVGDGSHLKLRVQSKGRPPLDCIAFGLGDCQDAVELGSCVDLCYSIRLNTYNGARSAQLVGKAIRKCEQ